MSTKAEKVSIKLKFTDKEIELTEKEARAASAALLAIIKEVNIGLLEYPPKVMVEDTSATARLVCSAEIV